MWRDIEEKSELLTYRRDDGKAGQWLGAVLLVLGTVVLIGDLSFKHSWSGIDLFWGVLRLLLGGFVLLGGIFNLLCKSGITFDRRKRQLSNWTRSPWGVTNDEHDLRRYDQIAVGRGRMYYAKSLTTYEVYPVFLLGPGGVRHVIVAWIQDPVMTRKLAEEIGEYLGIPVVDRPDDRVSSPV